MTEPVESRGSGHPRPEGVALIAALLKLSQGTGRAKGARRDSACPVPTLCELPEDHSDRHSDNVRHDSSSIALHCDVLGL